MIRILGESTRRISKRYSVTWARKLCAERFAALCELRPSELDSYRQEISERVKVAAPDWIPATVLFASLDTVIVVKRFHM
jgi:hypothetical protein